MELPTEVRGKGTASWICERGERRRRWRMKWFAAVLLGFFVALCEAEPVTLNVKADGYRGIWYQNQPLKSEYAFKYSGGLGTYCAKHSPFAVYSAEANKTFFCYGGTVAGLHTKRDLTIGGIGAHKTEGALLHMVSYYDHETGMVPRPTVILDKKTYDAHDNPVISIDDKGYLWVFSTSHGTMRKSYVHRSVKPFDIDAFERVEVVREEGESSEAVTNFSYFQAWRFKDDGFAYFFTRYKGGRINCFASSEDGVRWENWQAIAGFGEGHYQVSAVAGGKAGAAFNYHPKGKGLNWRTNLYYMETDNKGRSWESVDGKSLATPLSERDNDALVRAYEADGLLVYMKDLVFDKEGRPHILYVTSKGYASGPDNGPRVWRLARWDGSAWRISEIAESDNNYDMGSLYVEGGEVLRLIAPTDEGPQAYNPGGEVAIWRSRDNGANWEKEKEVTKGSTFNHTYVRRPVNAHSGFYGFWADGHGRKPSGSRLYFCDKEGNAYRLPETMDAEFSKPVPLGEGHSTKAK